jgi:hypothetical protein
MVTERVAKRRPETGSVPRGLKLKVQAMLAGLTTSARPRHAASPSTRRVSFARRRHAASMAVLVILTGPSRSTLTAASAEPDAGHKGRPDRTLAGHNARRQAERGGWWRKPKSAKICCPAYICVG